MEVIDTASISKGCFAVCAEGKQAPIAVPNYIDIRTIKAAERCEMAQTLWNDISIAVKKLNESLQENLFSNLVTYIGEVFKETNSKHPEIPTAVLSTGVNMPDHADLFQDLKKKIKDFISPHVVTLQASDCSNMKHFMRTIGDQLMQDDAITVDSETCNEFDAMKKKSTPLTISMIKEWYNKTINLQNFQRSPRKKAKLSSGTSLMPPVVILFQDLEGFSAKILQDFIVMTSLHAVSLPMVFVFGIATSWSEVSERLLPHSVIVNLSVRIFSAPLASSHLALIVDNILLSWKYPFKLSGRCLQLLLDVFLCHDFSITNFLHALKFCVLEHFYEQPSSFLCVASEHKATCELSKLSKRDIEFLWNLPSVQRHVSTLSGDGRKRIKTEAGKRKQLAVFLKHFHSYHESYFQVLRSLHAMTSSLPQYPLGKQLRELYIACDRNNLCGYAKYKEAFTFLKMAVRIGLAWTAKDDRMSIFDFSGSSHVVYRRVVSLCFSYDYHVKTEVSSRDQLIERLQNCCKHLDCEDQAQSNDADFELNLASAREKIFSVIKDLELIGESSNTKVDDDDDFENEDTLETVKYAYQLQEAAKQLRSETQEEIKQIRAAQRRHTCLPKPLFRRLRNRCEAKRKKKLSKFERLREDILAYLNHFFEYHLRRVQSLPLHEIHYFDSTSTVKRHLVAAPRLSIQTALSDPYKYLKVKSLETVVDGVIPSNAPDICVAYKLHNECGNLINLYDWMQAFHTIVTSSDDVNDQQGSPELDEVTQARFIRAVSELQLLGFIRPTKKKTDHVQRLTWSHV